MTTTQVSVSKTPTATFVKERHAAGTYSYTTETLETTDCPLYRKRLVQAAKDLAAGGSCALVIKFANGSCQRSYGSLVRYDTKLDRIEAAADVTMDSDFREIVNWQPVESFWNYYTGCQVHASTHRNNG